MGEKKNILLIGSGGREYALAWRLKDSPLLGKFYVCPGSDAFGQWAEIVDIAGEDVTAAASWCAAHEIDLVIVGPEQPLVDGLADALKAQDIAVFGPCQRAAMLEGSKIAMKEFLRKHQIPTADFQSFTEAQAAKNYVKTRAAAGHLPIVIKTDGLAAGKGVTVAQNLDEALAAVDAAMADGKFGSAGERLVIEEFMAGEEISWFAICDGENAKFIGSAQDYKRAFDGNRGPNTGGMGAFSPARQETPALNAEIEHRILQPLMNALNQEHIPYCGILFFGLMLTDTGPKVIEINVRFGDPECQTLMPRIDHDLPTLLADAAQGKLPESVRLKDNVALAVTYAAKGYPESYRKGSEIAGLDRAARVPNILICHAGTKIEAGRCIANGGRVLNIVAHNQPSLAQSIETAYQSIAQIKWPDGFYRKDIGAALHFSGNDDKP